MQNEPTHAWKNSSALGACFDRQVKNYVHELLYLKYSMALPNRSYTIIIWTEKLSALYD